ncbi:MAG TPA: isoprenylcysteine carboxylmethyltransferase family protein [Caldithrix abyssi]|uniref:Isoprenylcysteine carboxylmethyltransferase family protein n=1 Tax=Caldithrix abyssi TaxID=187145 RepID=A0A7V4U1U2_CALAY|nr:isoprenylcysteine carboxylmethyltransferase family protein [Caldithrix abyssi]
MDKIIIFLTLSVFLIFTSRRTLFNIKSHGFYRFLSWECIAWLLASNYNYWFQHPFSVHQIFAWFFLLISIYLVIAGLILIKKIGKPTRDRNEKTLYQFEQTTELIKTGIYKYIRHPLYSSLLFLTWGIYLKNPASDLFFISLLSTVFLYLTAKFDEVECIKFFGNKYIEYMKTSKRFIPYII